MAVSSNCPLSLGQLSSRNAKRVFRTNATTAPSADHVGASRFPVHDLNVLHHGRGMPLLRRM